MRKLVTIQRIIKLEPIEGADRIETATIKGWKCVVKKGEFKEGDLCVYFEIDSFLPEREEFEFLRKSCAKTINGETRFRIRTIKLKKQISQGLALPLTILDAPYDDELNVYLRTEGSDVTEFLDVIKYEPPIPAQLSGKMKGYRPDFVPKTDEERIQNLVSELEEYKESNKKFYATEKLDGSSMSVYYNKGEFGVCSRNLDLIKDDKNSFWRVAVELDLEEKLKKLDKNIVIQGELIGPGIQGNKYNLQKLELRVFNVIDIDSLTYSFSESLPLLKSLGLMTVPEIVLDFGMAGVSVDFLVEFSKMKSLINEKIQREGIVIRSTDQEISFKVINPDYLLKFEE